MKAIKTKIARGEKIQSKKDDEQNKLLNTKRIRATNSENIESDGVNTETNETTLNKKKKNQDSESQNEQSGSKEENSQRSNRFFPNKRAQFLRANKTIIKKRKRTKSPEKNNKRANNIEKEINDNSISSGRKDYQPKVKKIKKNNNNKKNNLKNQKNYSKKSLTSLIGMILSKKTKKYDRKFERLNEKIKAQNAKIGTQNKTIKGQNKKINELNRTINGQNKTIEGQNKTIEGQNKTIEGQNKTINEQNEKIALLYEIQNQSDKNSKLIKEYLMSLGTQWNSLYNSCKVLFIRKTCDFILEGIISNYSNSIALTKKRFKNNRGIEFPLMVFINDINGINKFSLNLIADFLMETKQNCSSIMHLNSKDKISEPIMKELFFILLDVSNDKKNNEYNLEISDKANILFDNNSNEVNYEEEGEEEGEGEEINESNDELSENKDDGNDSEEDTIIQLLSDNNHYDIEITDLKNILKDKVNSNKIGIKEISIKNKEIINSSHFYRLWLKSFQKEKFKKTKDYKSFIDTNVMKSEKDMNGLLVQLLPKYKVNFFDNDPQKFTKKIQNKISKY